MKHLILFSLMTLSVEAFALGPVGGLMKSVGVVGPKGDVILYYREGAEIVIKNCAPLTILGKTPKEAKESCQGNTNKVPVS